jgi:hypothetical protein
MSERNPFQQNPAQPHEKGSLPCEEWEALLADALDGTLAAEDAAVFTAHGNDCPMCAEMLAQAKQGQEWMRFLQEEPPAPADLVSKILGRTSGATLPQLAVAGAVQPMAPQISHFAMRRSFRDSRMLMTAAMAFFSIALTLNLIGVRLDSLSMADLKPSTLQMNIARQFYGARKQMVSYYENIRFVYEVESKMRELRQDADSEQKTQPRRDEKQQPSPQGDGHKTGGRLQSPKNLMPPKTVIWGQPTLASLDRPIDGAASMPHDEKRVEVTVLAVKRKADQAERSLA